MSVQHFITMKKITRAKSLLTTTNEKIDRIVELIGYENYISFSKIFKEHTGLTPTQYRHNNCNSIREEKND